MRRRAHYWDAPLKDMFRDWFRDAHQYLDLLNEALDASAQILSGFERARAVIAPQVYARRLEVYAALVESQRHNASGGPTTFLHGDVHPGNWYLTLHSQDAPRRGAIVPRAELETDHFCFWNVLTKSESQPFDGERLGARWHVLQRRPRASAHAFSRDVVADLAHQSDHLHSRPETRYQLGPCLFEPSSRTRCISAAP